MPGDAEETADQPKDEKGRRLSKRRPRATSKNRFGMTTNTDIAWFHARLDSLGALARRSLIIGAVLVCTSALAQVPGMGVVLGGFINSVFSTWNPSDAGSGFSFSNANRTASVTPSTGGYRLVRGTASHSNGKWYFEDTVGAITDSGVRVGIAASSLPLSNYVGQTAAGYGLNSAFGYLYNNGGVIAVLSGFNVSDVVGVAVDLTNNKIYFSVNGAWGGNPSAGTGGIAIAPGAYFPAADGGGNFTATHTINTGKTAFANAAPSGFAAWH